MNSLLTWLIGRPYIFWHMKQGMRAAIWIEETEVLLAEVRLEQAENRLVWLENELHHKYSKENPSPHSEQAIVDMRNEEGELKPRINSLKASVGSLRMQLENTKNKLKFIQAL